MEPALGTILGVWAHPDDETYLSAGVMAAAARRGERVLCATATRGEYGSMDEQRWPSAALGAVRERELLRSLEILGVRDHRWLDYLDGSCDRVPDEEGIARVVALLGEAQPDSVLTFGPEGMTGHPDHRAVCAWTTAAFRRAAKPGARLYYATLTPEWVAEYLPRLQPFNVYAPGTPVPTPRANLAIDFPLPPDLRALKLAAIKAHESQVEGLLLAFGEDGFREALSSEWFRLGSER